MLYAMIDIGSNTIRMAIYRIDGKNAEMLMKKKQLVGLAAHVREGYMTQAGIDNTVQTLMSFKAFLAPFAISNVVAFTTAALRNAKNSKEAVGEIERRTGIPIRIIPGEQEAEYDFIGAIHGIDATRGLIVDIGGASTELVYYEDATIREKVSLPLGSLAMQTSHVKAMLPTKREAYLIADEVRYQLSEAKELSGIEVPALIGIGGTFKGADALCRETSGETGPMTRAALGSLIERLTTEGALTEELTCHLMRAVPDRIHTITPGLIIAGAILDFFHAQSVTYSDSGVREGYIYKEIFGD